MKLKCFGRLAAMVVAALLATGVARAQATPETAWNLDIAEGSCTLTGKIPGAVPMEVSLFTVAGSDTYRLSFSGKSVRHARDRDNFPVRVAFGGVEQRFEKTAWGDPIKGDLGHVVFVHGLGPDMVVALGRASSIALEGKYPIRPLALTGTQPAARAMMGCVRDQLVEWGADPAQFAPNGNTPVALGSRDEWLTGGDWDRALSGNRGGVDIVLVLAVAPDGKVDGCSAVEPASPTVTKALCQALVTRRLFTPAHDASGKAVRGVSTYDIHLGVVRVSI